MERLWKDIKFGLRMLVKSPGLTLAAIGSLALGIGANTAIFTVVNGIFFPPLPIEDASGVYSMFTLDEKNPGFHGVSYPNFQDYRDRQTALDEIAAYQFAPMSYRREDGGGDATIGLLVTGNYFDLLRVQMLQGRSFVPEEDRTPGSHPVAVVSHGFWQRRTAGDPDLLGKTIFINRVALTVIGIAPPDFTGTDIGIAPEIWMPMMMYERVSTQPGWIDLRRGLINSVLGRLEIGTTLASAQEEFDAISAHLASEYPNDNAGRRLTLIPTLQARVNPNVRDNFVQALGLMVFVVGLVLLIACANVANLLLSRATGRRQEVAIKLALGSSTGRLVRQLLTESVLLALVGAAFGLLVARWTTGLLVRSIPPTPFPIALSFDLNGSVLLITLGIAVATGLVFGLAPALQAVRADVLGALKNETPGSMGADRRFGLRNLLVIGQVAVSLMLLVGAGLFIRSMQSAQTIDPGFDVEGGLVATMNLGLEGYSEDDGKAFLRQLGERVAAIPGVRAATVAQSLPLSLFGAGLTRTTFIEGDAAADEEDGVLIGVTSIGLGFFDALGINIVDGRPFDVTDNPDSVRAAIINEVMADTFWPDESPIGQRFMFHGQLDRPLTVVGVASYAKVSTLGEDPTPLVYMPIEQEYSGTMLLMSRTEGDPMALADAVRREIRALDPEMPIFGITTLSDQVDASLFPTRIGAGMLGVFGALGLTLAAIGLYGVMNYSVARRTREIGIRMALGANSTGVLKLVVQQALLLVVVGLSVGVGLAALMGRQMASLLYGISGTDLFAFAGTSLVLLLVASVASLVPALRATRVDPVRALRFE